MQQHNAVGMILVSGQKCIAGQTLSPAVFRFEPFILALEARDMQAAQAFLHTARQAGFRESGATASGGPPQRVMVGIRCSIRLEVSRAGRTNACSQDTYTCHAVLVMSMSGLHCWSLCAAMGCLSGANT